jgi:hypothetical protein
MARDFLYIKNMILVNRNTGGWGLALLLAIAASAEELRPLSADRPDATESPYTVPPRHVQIEMDIAAYLRDHAQQEPPRVRREGWALAVTNLKAGIAHDIDVQLVVETFVSERTEAGGVAATAEGFGDMMLRGKFNLWGNDGGETAFAAMPFVTFPTASDDLGAEGVEGGLILPLAVELPRGLGLGVQAQFDAVRVGSSYQLDLSGTATVGRDLFGRVSGFLEVLALFPDAGQGDWVGTLNTGLVYEVHADFLIDVSARFGLSRASDDLAVFVGFTRRF